MYCYAGDEVVDAVKIERTAKTYLNEEPDQNSWVKHTPRYNQVYKERHEQFMDDYTYNEPLKEEYHPNWNKLNFDYYMYYYNKLLINIYRYKPPTDYYIGLLVDPCRTYNAQCCEGVYGEAEYFNIENDYVNFTIVPQAERVCEVRPTDSRYLTRESYYCLVDENNNTLSKEQSRLADETITFNAECVGYNDPKPYCVGKQYMRKRSTIFPQCWDRNDTVIGTQTCRDPEDNSSHSYCMEIAYKQTGYIVECNNEFKNDPHCGTYIEIHKNNKENKYEILSDIKLKGGFHSGYHDSYISLLYKGNTTRVLCKGEYELWWVQRTRSNFIIERTKVFNVTKPECDWDYINNRYYIYATVKEEKEIIDEVKPPINSPFL